MENMLVRLITGGLAIPATGDDNMLILWLAMAGGAALLLIIGVVLLIINNSRKKDGSRKGSGTRPEKGKRTPQPDDYPDYSDDDMLAESETGTEWEEDTGEYQVEPAGQMMPEMDDTIQQDPASSPDCQESMPPAYNIVEDILPSRALREWDDGKAGKKVFRVDDEK